MQLHGRSTRELDARRRRSTRCGACCPIPTSSPAGSATRSAASPWSRVGDGAAGSRWTWAPDGVESDRRAHPRRGRRPHRPCGSSSGERAAPARRRLLDRRRLGRRASSASSCECLRPDPGGLRGRAAEPSSTRSPTRPAATVLRAVAEDGPLTATELAARLPVTRQAVAKHLEHAARRRPRVVSERDGRDVRFSFDPRRSTTPSRWITAVGARWDRRLAAPPSADASRRADRLRRLGHARPRSRTLARPRARRRRHAAWPAPASSSAP